MTIRESDFKKIDSSLKLIKKSIDKPQKIKADRPLRIELVGQEKTEKWKLILRFVILFLVIILAAIWVFKVNKKKPTEFTLSPNPIKCSINYSSQVSVGDEGIIELTLTNNLNDSIQGTKCILVFPQNAFIKISSNGGSSVVKFDTMDACEKRTKKVKFQLEKSFEERILEIHLKVKAGTFPEIPGTCTVRISCIPHMKTIFQIFFGILSAVIIPVFTDKARKIF